MGQRIAIYSQVRSNRPRGRLARVALAIGIIMIGTGCANQPSRHDPWLGSDKFAHFFLSAIAAGALSQVAENRGMARCPAFIGSVSLVLIGGAMKETYDKNIKGTYWSNRDMVANGLGAIAGSQLAYSCP